MLRIRREQLAVLGKVPQRDMECRLLAHVKQAFAERFARMGEQEVRQWVRLGMDRAAALGLEAEYDVLRYVDLMFLLSMDFETDATLPWVQDILGDVSLSAEEKLDCFFKHVGSV